MEDTEAYDYLFKVLIIGDEASGKTALLTRYADRTFTEEYESTAGFDFQVKIAKYDGKTIKAQIWDTGGQDRFRPIFSSYYRGCHGAIIVFDVTDRESFERVKYWIADVKRYASDSTPVLLVGNKTDLEKKRCVTTEEAKSVAVINDMEYVETSAKTNSNVKEAFEILYMDICKKVSQQPPQQENVSRLDAVSEDSDTDDATAGDADDVTAGDADDATAGDADDMTAGDADDVTAGAETVASVNTEEIPPWAKALLEQLEKLNTQLKSVEKLETTVASMSERLDTLANKMSKFDKRRNDFKSGQAQSVKPRK